MKRLLRILATAALLGAPLGCADDDVKPQEPVAPKADTSVYPEDPQLASPEDKTTADAGSPKPEEYDADTGALTTDPFGELKNVPKMNDKSDDTSKDVPQTPADQLNIPPDEGMDAAAKANQKQYDKTQKATPSVPDAMPQPAHAPRTPKSKPAKGGKSQTTAARAVRYVVPKMLNVRAKADPKAKIVRTLKGGERLSCTMQGSYCKLKDGEFVRASQLSERKK